MSAETFFRRLERLITWLNREPAAPVTFVDPGFRSDLFTPPQPFVELYLVTEGSLQLRVGKLSAVLGPGDLALANAHLGNEGVEVRGRFRYGCISIEVPSTEPFASWSRVPLLDTGKAADFEAMKRLYEEIDRLHHGAQQSLTPVLLKAKLLELLVLAASPAGPAPSAAGPQNEHVRRAMDFMRERRSDASLTLARVARYARVSPGHLVRLFDLHVGDSPMRHLLQLRMRHAQALLARSPLTIKEIAPLVGFADPLYLSRMFRQHTGLSPRAYRQRVQRL